MDAGRQLRAPVRAGRDRARIGQIMPGLADGGAQCGAAKGEFAPPLWHGARHRGLFCGQKRRGVLRQRQNRAAMAGRHQAQRQIAQRLRRP